MKIRGYVRKNCLLQLLEEGQLGVKQLAERVGSDTNVTHGALAHLMSRSLVTAAPDRVRIDGARATVQYGLTCAGIELALQLEPADATADGIPAELM